jgi:integrase
MTVRKRGGYYDYEFWVNNEHYSGTFNGKRGKPIAKDKRGAKDLEAIERRKVLSGNYHEEHQREELKDFSTFVDKVSLPFAKENHDGYGHDLYRTQVLKEFFSGKRFDEITMMNIVKYVNERLNSTTVRVESLPNGKKVNRKRSPTTVNKELTLLSSIFRMAKREKVATNNPCEEVPRSVRKKIPARYRRNRYLTWHEEKELFQSGLIGRREHLRPLAHLAIWTGMRRGELLRLKCEHVNLGKTHRTFTVKGERIVLESNWLLIEKTKNGKPRCVPLSKPVRRILEVLSTDATSDGYVFGNPTTGSHVKDIKHAFRGACEDAGISDLTFHDLRHTWSTRAAECGVTETVRRDILGHSSSTITGDYTHSTPESQLAAMELVASYGSRRVVNLDKISTKRRSRAIPAAS